MKTISINCFKILARRKRSPKRSIWRKMQSMKSRWPQSFSRRHSSLLKSKQSSWCNSTSKLSSGLNSSKRLKPNSWMKRNKSFKSSETSNRRASRSPKSKSSNSSSTCRTYRPYKWIFNSFSSTSTSSSSYLNNSNKLSYKSISRRRSSIDSTWPLSNSKSKLWSLNRQKLFRMLHQWWTHLHNQLSLLRFLNSRISLPSTWSMKLRLQLKLPISNSSFSSRPSLLNKPFLFNLTSNRSSLLKTKSQLRWEVRIHCNSNLCQAPKRSNKVSPKQT